MSRQPKLKCWLHEEVTSSLYDHVTKSDHRDLLKSLFEKDPPKKPDARNRLNKIQLGKREKDFESGYYD